MNHFSLLLPRAYKGIRLFPVLFIPFFILLYTSCGGGSGGGPSSWLNYTGEKSFAAISPSNATDLAIGSIYTGPRIPYIEKFNITGNEQVTENPAGRIPLRELFSSLEKKVNRRSAELFAANSSYTVATPVQGTETGACGGTFSISGDIDFSTGNFTVSFSIDHYSDCVFTYTGSGSATGVMNVNTYRVKRITMNYSRLTVEFNGWSFTGRGTYFINQELVPVMERLDFVSRDDSTGKLYWYRDYQFRTEEKSDGTGTYYEISISGTFYDSTEGYVLVTTEVPLIIYAGNQWPSSGTLLVTGDGGTWARLEFISPNTYHLFADTDGDGLTDYD
ncbi:MAG: hypothetical protein D6713_06500, partial [Deltaproteobacteria bacterium]